MDDGYDYDDEYDPETLDAEPVRAPESIQKWFSCLGCRGQLMLLIPWWEGRMNHGIRCSCRQEFVFDDRADDREWRGPMGTETTAPDDTKPNHVRDAVRANLD